MTAALRAVADCWAPAPPAAGLAIDFLTVGLAVFAAVTLVFHLLDRTLQRRDFFGRWNPRSLPPLDLPWVRIPIGATILELLLSVVFLRVFVWVARNDTWAGESVTLRIAPEVAAYFPWVLLLIGLAILDSLVKLFRPRWTRPGLAFAATKLVKLHRLGRAAAPRRA